MNTPKIKKCLACGRDDHHRKTSVLCPFNKNNNTSDNIIGEAIQTNPEVSKSFSSYRSHFDEIVILNYQIFKI